MISCARTTLLGDLTDFVKSRRLVRKKVLKTTITCKLNISNVSLTPLLLVIVVSDPDDVVKDVFTEDVYQLVAVLRHVPHIIHSYHFLQLPRGNERTKEVWKRTTVICGADVFQKFPAN